MDGAVVDHVDALCFEVDSVNSDLSVIHTAVVLGLLDNPIECASYVTARLEERMTATIWMRVSEHGVKAVVTP